MAGWNPLPDHQPGTPPAVRAARGRIGARHGRSPLRRDVPMPPDSAPTTLPRGASRHTATPAPVGLSIVIPVYRGAATIRTLVEALAALRPHGGLEIVLVNDGSPDNSGEIGRDLVRTTPVPVVYIEHM